MKTQAVKDFLLTAGPGANQAMADLIDMGFNLAAWSTDHDELLAERQATGRITVEEKQAIQETFGKMAAELTSFHY